VISRPRHWKVCSRKSLMIALGIVLVVIGFVATIPLLWTMGLVVVIVGGVLGIAGYSSHQVGGRRHWY